MGMIAKRPDPRLVRPLPPFERIRTITGRTAIYASRWRKPVNVRRQSLNSKPPATSSLIPSSWRPWANYEKPLTMSQVPPKDLTLRSAQISSPPNSAHFDFTFLSGDVDELLIASPDLWQYSGSRSSQIAQGSWPETHWSGGGIEHGYFCIEHPSGESQLRLRHLLGW